MLKAALSLTEALNGSALMLSSTTKSVRKITPLQNHILITFIMFLF